MEKGKKSKEKVKVNLSVINNSIITSGNMGHFRYKSEVVKIYGLG